ncbi:MAG: hypothetical protein IT349_02265 [Candidatus Eisenbacteria bacterium]|nr:hypothetical protein [Candidatus Eisenbacteria bacterium]MCC7140903.1 hypothetical protein [Candidatus Eisenbacteria bacterium]
MLDSYQSRGRYVITRDEAQVALGGSAEALKKAVQRLVAKQRLVVPRRGFFVIVPIEYLHAGAPPPSWYIDDMMRYCGRQYYVSLLTAAALHGAAHHQPQEFQVVTDSQLRGLTVGRARIRFFRKLRVEKTPSTDVKTETGTMRVATPEATALDLFRYVKGSGRLGHIATVLAELAEKMEAKRLLAAAIVEGDQTKAQRLGHVLDAVGESSVTPLLASWIAETQPPFTPLRPDRPSRLAARDDRWRVLVNESVEAET